MMDSNKATVAVYKLHTSPDTIPLSLISDVQELRRYIHSVLHIDMVSDIQTYQFWLKVSMMTDTEWLPIDYFAKEQKNKESTIREYLGLLGDIERKEFIEYRYLESIDTRRIYRVNSIVAWNLATPVLHYDLSLVKGWDDSIQEYRGSEYFDETSQKCIGVYNLADADGKIRLAGEEVLRPLSADEQFNVLTRDS